MDRAYKYNLWGAILLTVEKLAFKYSVSNRTSSQTLSFNNFVVKLNPNLMTDASQKGNVKVTFSGFRISSILRLSICQKKSDIHRLANVCQMNKK